MIEWPNFVAEFVTDGITCALGLGIDSWLAGDWDQLAGILMNF
jgi:hypothetical protein